MKITRANLHDLNDIAPLFDLYRQFYKEDPDIDKCRDFLQHRISRGESIIFLAKSDAGKAVGFTQLYPTFCSVELISRLVLYDLFVDENVRKQGVAKSLMDAAFDFASNNGFKRLTLETAVDNYPGQALYEKEGWKRDREFYTYHLPV